MWTLINRYLTGTIFCYAYVRLSVNIKECLLYSSSIPFTTLFKGFLLLCYYTFRPRDPPSFQTVTSYVLVFRCYSDKWVDFASLVCCALEFVLIFHILHLSGLTYHRFLSRRLQSWLKRKEVCMARCCPAAFCWRGKVVQSSQTILQGSHTCRK